MKPYFLNSIWNFALPYVFKWRTMISLMYLTVPCLLWSVPPFFLFFFFFSHPCLCCCCVCVCVRPTFTICCPFFTIVLFGSLCKHICLRKRKQQKTLSRTKETYLGLSNDESCHDTNTVAGDGAPSPIRKSNLSDCQDFLCQDSGSLEPPGPVSYTHLRAHETG